MTGRCGAAARLSPGIWQRSASGLRIKKRTPAPGQTQGGASAKRQAKALGGNRLPGKRSDRPLTDGAGLQGGAKIGEPGGRRAGGKALNASLAQLIEVSMQRRKRRRRIADSSVCSGVACCSACSQCYLLVDLFRRSRLRRPAPASRAGSPDTASSAPHPASRRWRAGRPSGRRGLHPVLCKAHRVTLSIFKSDQRQRHSAAGWRDRRQPQCSEPRPGAAAALRREPPAQARRWRRNGPRSCRAPPATAAPVQPEPHSPGDVMGAVKFCCGLQRSEIARQRRVGAAYLKAAKRRGRAGGVAHRGFLARWLMLLIRRYSASITATSR